MKIQFIWMISTWRLSLYEWLVHEDAVHMNDWMTVVVCKDLCVCLHEWFMYTYDNYYYVRISMRVCPYVLKKDFCRYTYVVSFVQIDSCTHINLYVLRQSYLISRCSCVCVMEFVTSCNTLVITATQACLECNVFESWDYVCSGVRDTLQHAHTHCSTGAPGMQGIRDVLRLCVCSGVRYTLQHAHTHCNTSALRMQRIRDVLRLMQRFAQHTHTHTHTHTWVTPKHTWVGIHIFEAWKVLRSVGHYNRITSRYYSDVYVKKKKTCIPTHVCVGIHVYHTNHVWVDIHITTHMSRHTHLLHICESLHTTTIYIFSILRYSYGSASRALPVIRLQEVISLFFTYSLHILLYLFIVHIFVCVFLKHVFCICSLHIHIHYTHTKFEYAKFEYAKFEYAKFEYAKFEYAKFILYIYSLHIYTHTQMFRYQASRTLRTGRTRHPHPHMTHPHMTHPHMTHPHMTHPHMSDTHTNMSKKKIRRVSRHMFENVEVQCCAHLTYDTHTQINESW